MHAILGATGQVGGALLDALLECAPAERIRMLGRHPPAALPRGVEWRQADLRGEAAVLAEALSGVSTVFALSPVAVDAVDVHADGNGLARVLAEAIVLAGRPRVVALSSQGAQLADGTGIIRTLHALETALLGTGARTTFLRSTFFMQSWLPFVHAAMAGGIWHAMHAPPDALLEAVSANDVGRCAARLLCDPEAAGIVNVTGAGAWSELDVARTVERLSGRPIVLEMVPREQRAAVLRAAGLGASYAEALAAMHAAIEDGAVPSEPAPVEAKGVEMLETVIARAVASANA